MIKTTLMSSCHWETLVPFCLRKKRPENPLLTLTVNCRKIVQKNKLCHSTQQETGIDDMSCFLTIAFFDWKIGVFQQTVVRFYCILNVLINHSNCFIARSKMEVFVVLLVCSLQPSTNVTKNSVKGIRLCNS